MAAWLCPGALKSSGHVPDLRRDKGPDLKSPLSRDQTVSARRHEKSRSPAGKFFASRFFSAQILTKPLHIISGKFFLKTGFPAWFYFYFRHGNAPTYRCNVAFFTLLSKPSGRLFSGGLLVPAVGNVHAMGFNRLSGAG